MGNLADFIEQYLRNMFAGKSNIELQRCELAKMFRCAPSQINYVLETRFTIDRGYIIESKRGGGGYIRITHVKWESAPDLPGMIDQLIPGAINADELDDLLYRLAEHRLITPEEAQMAQFLLEKNFGDLPAEIAAGLRAKFLKMLLMVLGSKSRQ